MAGLRPQREAESGMRVRARRRIHVSETVASVPEEGIGSEYALDCCLYCCLIG